MFHEVTDRAIAKKRKRNIVVLCLVVVLAIAIWLAVGAVQANARAQGAVALRESIVSSAKQCCAIEGAYPSTLEHLESNYGLVINRDDYVVSYECFAGNIMPSVVVTPR